MAGKTDGYALWTCQWPGCPYFAAREIRRGERTGFLHLCLHHVNQFRCMTNGECADIAARAVPSHRVPVANKHLIHQPPPDDFDAATSLGGTKVA